MRSAGLTLLKRQVMADGGDDEEPSCGCSSVFIAAHY